MPANQTTPRRLAELEDHIDSLMAALRPFATITPSTLHAKGEDEGYSVVLTHPKDRPDFTRADLERARELLGI